MNNPIGVFDSGVGGLTVAREIMRQLPNEDLVYFGDTARVPYGSKSKNTVLKYSRQIVRFLRTKNVKAIVVACNTASALALDEIAAEIDMPVDKVREIMRVAQEPVSLETPIGEEEDSHLGDFIPDDEALSPADAASASLLKEQLGEVLKTLTPREEKVLSLRIGLEDGHPRTLEEVGKEFNVTRERIRQIEAKALRKLRHPSRSKKLRDFLD